MREKLSPQEIALYNSENEILPWKRGGSEIMLSGRKKREGGREGEVGGG